MVCSVIWRYRSLTLPHRWQQHRPTSVCGRRRTDQSRILQIISYDSPRGGVSVITEKGETTTSFLLIQKAHPSDSGRYQCNPFNAKSKSVMVHVLNAAMKHGGQAHHRSSHLYCLILCVCLLLLSL